MTLLAFGIHHKTASVAPRERIMFSLEKLDPVFGSVITSRLAQQSAVLLWICHRIDLHLSTRPEDFEARSSLQACLNHWRCNYHRTNEGEITTCLYGYDREETVTHLIRAAGSLDSFVPRKPEILAQVKKAVAATKSRMPLSRKLAPLAQKSFSASKRISTETALGTNALSIAFVACKMAPEIFNSLSQLNVLLVGAGETLDLVARHLSVNIKYKECL